MDSSLKFTTSGGSTWPTVSGRWHQFAESEAIVVFQEADLCLEPLAGLDVLEDVVAELFQEVRVTLCAVGRHLARSLLFVAFCFT